LLTKKPANKNEIVSKGDDFKSFILDDFKSCYKNIKGDGVFHKKICQFDVGKIDLQRNEAGWHSFICSSKDKANNDHEILIPFNYCRCGIQV